MFRLNFNLGHEVTSPNLTIIIISIIHPFYLNSLCVCSCRQGFWEGSRWLVLGLWQLSSWVVVGLQLHLVALALVLWELDDPGPG